MTTRAYKHRIVRTDPPLACGGLLAWTSAPHTHMAFETSNHNWRIGAETEPLGAEGGAGANLSRGMAFSIREDGTRYDRSGTPCVLKTAPDADGDMQQELRVLRACRENGLPINTGDGQEYYLGGCSREGRLTLVFRLGPSDLAQHFGMGDKVTCRPQRPELAVHIAIGTLEALKNLHAAGFIHSDIQPKNILFNPYDGAVSIIDFGAAVEIGERGRDRCWEYSAPEQWGGGECTRRTDAFAVVGVLIYLLTGRAPFAIEGKREAHRRLCEDVVLSPESPQREGRLDGWSRGDVNRPLGEQIQHHCGVDGDHGLRHLLYYGMTRPVDKRWTCEKLTEELLNLHGAIIGERHA